jgi:hypothetical protein
MRSIAVINVSDWVTDAEVRHWVAAIQANMAEFCLAWGLEPCALGFVPKDVGTRLRPEGMWMQVIANTPRQASYLGYHEVAASGAPIGYTFTETDLLAKTSVSATLSHEIWEMLVDPFLERVVEFGPRRYSVEVADPVEADLCGKVQTMPTGQPVLVSGYCLPAYFDRAEQGPYDSRGVLQDPLPALAPGGYLAYQDLEGVWSQISRFGSVRGKTAARPQILSRRYRRMFREWDTTEQLETA